MFDFAQKVLNSHEIDFASSRNYTDQAVFARFFLLNFPDFVLRLSL